MPTLPYGWITFQARGPVVKSKAPNGGLSQAVTRAQLCHLGELSVGGERVSTPQHSKGKNLLHRLGHADGHRRVAQNGGLSGMPRRLQPAPGLRVISH